MYSPDASFRIFSMNFSNQRNNGPPGSNNPRDNNPPGQYTYQGTTIKKVLDKNEACIPCRRRKTKCDGLRPACGTCSRLDRECIYVDKEPKEGGSRSRSAKASASNSGSGTATGSMSQLFQSRRDRASVSDALNTPQSSNTSLEMHETPMMQIDNPHSPFTPHPVSSGVSPAELGLHPPGRSSQSQFDPSQSGTPKSLSNILDLESDSIHQQFLGSSAAPGYGMFDMDYQGFANYPLDLSPGGSFGGTGIALSGAQMGNLSVASHQVLPSQQVMEELVTIFFNVIHPLMPCLHQRRFMTDLRPPGRLSMPCALILSVLAISAPMHSDPAVQARGYGWHLLCKQHIDMAAFSGRFSLQNVQAVIWWTFKGILMSEMAPTWIMLGTAYRLAIPLGLHRVDARKYQSFLPPPQSESHKEERRRVMWAIYRLDRYSFCCGWPMVIDDKDLCVNYPVEEHIFQSSDTMEEFDRSLSEPFSPEIDDLVTPSTKPRGGSHYLYKMAVLIGKVVDFNKEPNIPTDPAVREKEFRSLEASLTCFRVSLPKELRNIIGGNDHTAVAQLQTMIHASAILLHHGAMVDPATSNSPLQQSNNYGPPAESFPHIWMQNNHIWNTGSSSNPCAQIHDDSHSFALCLSAAEGILSTIKETIDLADTGPYNPFVTPAYFICARILCIRWMETRDPQIKNDIDLIVLVIDRISELWGGVAGKYKELILFDLARNPATVASLKYLDGKSYIGSEFALAFLGPDSEMAG